MNKKSDIELWSLCQSNSEEAFKTLFNRYYGYLAMVAMRIVQDESGAKDIAQNVFVKIWERRSKIKINSSIKSYLHRSALNMAINHKKARKANYSINENYHVPTKLSANSDLERTELKQIIHKAIDTLPDRCRTIFILNRYENLSYKEIGNHLEISPRTVEVQLAKARKILRDLLASYRYIYFYFIYYADKGIDLLDCLY